MPKKLRRLVLLALALTLPGVYLIFSAQVSAHELTLTAIFTLLTGWVSLLAWHQMKLRFYPTPRQVMACWRIPWYVISDCWKVCAILLRDLAGKRAGSLFCVTPFFSGTTENDAPSILATLYMTTAPNSIVIGVHQDVLFFHQIEPSEVPLMIYDLEAGR